MRRSAVMALITALALSGAGVGVAALLGAFSSSLGEYGAVFLVNRNGGDLRRVTHDRRFHGYAWSPNGRWLAMSTRSVDAHGIDVPGPLELVEATTSRVHDVFLANFVEEVAWQSNTSIELVVTRQEMVLQD